MSADMLMQGHVCRHSDAGACLQGHVCRHADARACLQGHVCRHTSAGDTVASNNPQTSAWSVNDAGRL